MATHMEIDQHSRKRSRYASDPSDDAELVRAAACSKKTRLIDATDASSDPPHHTFESQSDDSAASTPASIDTDCDPFNARLAQPQPQPAARCSTIIAGWNQARRVELFVQGYPPALQLQLFKYVSSFLAQHSG